MRHWRGRNLEKAEDDHLKKVAKVLIAIAAIIIVACFVGLGILRNHRPDQQFPDMPARPQAPVVQHRSPDDAKAMAAIMAQSRKEYEERMAGTLKGWAHLPNYPTGPGRPLPIKVNFYELHDDYPTYLLCTYEVSESEYAASNEPIWFEASL